MRPRREHGGNTELSQLCSVVLGNRASHNNKNVFKSLRLQAIKDPWNERHVCTRKDRDADGVSILLQRCFDNAPLFSFSAPNNNLPFLFKLVLELGELDLDLAQAVVLEDRGVGLLGA